MSRQQYPNYPTVRAVVPKEKGGKPEDYRRGNTPMDIAQQEAVDNAEAVLNKFRVNSPDRNASLWLDDQIARSQNGVITQVIDLSPPLARVLLARNPSNRKISANTVENYARDMANGAWSFNGEPIIVSHDGFLNDGQHRCEAVLASNATIQTVLVIGPERASRLTLDQGKMRMAGDYLGMNGHIDSVALAAVAKYVWQHSRLGMLSSLSQLSPTKSEILDLVEKTPSIAESLKTIPAKGSDSVGGRSILAFAHWTFAKAGGSKTNADLFIESLVKGSNLGVRSPILYARNRLMSERGRLKPNEKAELMIRAWNANRRGDNKVGSLPIKGGALPAVER